MSEDKKDASQSKSQSKDNKATDTKTEKQPDKTSQKSNTTSDSSADKKPLESVVKDSSDAKQKTSDTSKTEQTKDSSPSDQPALEQQKPAPRKAAQPAASKGTSKGAIFDNKSMPRMETKKTTRKTPIISILAIIIALLTLGGAGWAGYQQFLMQQNWQQLQTDINRQISEQVSTNQQSVKTAQSGLDTAQANQQLIRQQSALINQLRDSLTVTQERLKDLSGRRNQDWLLAEAEYLIKLAEYKITLETDKQTAIGLLKAADEKVMSIGDNSLIELRQSLAQDISNLQLLVAPDISGIAVRLDTLSDQIPKLSIIALEFERDEEQNETPQNDNEPYTWSNFYEKFLDDYIKITDHSEPVKPLMTLEQRGLLNANIQLALQQAQVALLRSEQGLYLTNIDNAIEWIEFFFKKDEVADALLTNLKELRETRIKMDLPASLSSKRQIETINQDRLYQWLDETQPVSSTEQ